MGQARMQRGARASREVLRHTPTCKTGERADLGAGFEGRARGDEPEGRASPKLGFLGDLIGFERASGF